MITIDLQDDDVTQTKKASHLGKEKPLRDSGQRLDRMSKAGENIESRAAEPGLIARLLRVLFKEN